MAERTTNFGRYAGGFEAIMKPYGMRNRLMAGQIGGDCSAGYKWFHTLCGPAELDWGVCGNPASHRAV